MTLSILYILTFVCFSFFIFKQIIKDGFITIFTIFLFSIILFYYFAPALIFIFGMNAKSNQYFLSFIYESNSYIRIKIYFIVLLSLSTIIVSYYSCSFYIKRKTPIPQEKNDYFLSNSKNILRIVDSTCFYWFIVLFVFGLTGILLMIREIGLYGFIFSSGAARGESGDIGRAGSLLSYAKVLSKFIIASMSPGILLVQTRKSVSIFILLSVALTLSFLLEVFIAGKSSFIIFILPYCFLFFFKKGKMNYKAFILFFLLSILLVVVLEDFFYYLQNNVSLSEYRSSWTIEDYIVRYLFEFSYPYCNLLFSDEMIRINGYRYFLDYLAAVVNIIPAFLLGGFQITPFYTYTTSFYQSFYTQMIDGVPNDYIYLCLSQMGLFALFIISFILGKIFCFIDYYVLKFKHIASFLSINPAHFLTSCCFLGIVITLIEPYSAISSQPILPLSIVLCLHLNFLISISTNRQIEHCTLT